MNQINTPTLVLDIQRMELNLKRMYEKAEAGNLKFRPHFKTHQSKAIGKQFRSYPIDGITVSSLKMAQYFATEGWNSITVAFPINVLEIKEIDELAGEIDLRVLVVDKSTLITLEEHIRNDIGLYIELDPGYGRSGVDFNDFNKIEELITSINKSKKFRFNGFYCHAGHSYKSKSKEEVSELIKPVIEQLSKVRKYFNAPVCFGDTPSCSILNDFGGIDEISPGNFIFYDWNQVQIGSCKPGDIAVAMYCPVVAKYSERKELLIHGGAVHFSKDYELNNEGEKYFGIVAGKSGSAWNSPIRECHLKSISQEHGIVACSDSFFEEVSVGDSIPILPIHSCLTADLMGGYATFDGNSFDHISKNYK